MHDVNLLIRRLGRDQPRRQTDAFTEPQRGGLLGDERIGPAFNQKIVEPLRADAAAEAGRRLEQQQFEIETMFGLELEDAICGGESGNAPANDDDTGSHRLGFAAAVVIKSASISMNRGESFGQRERRKLIPAASAVFRASMSRS